jgi:hypothetical protein
MTAIDLLSVAFLISFAGAWASVVVLLQKL